MGLVDVDGTAPDRPGSHGRTALVLHAAPSKRAQSRPPLHAPRHHTSTSPRRRASSCQCELKNRPHGT